MKISYQDFKNLSHLSKEQIISLGHQNLLLDSPGIVPTLPIPPMLMFDRITKIEHNGKKGRIIAEQDIKLDDWFFMCHFKTDPVQPGCLGIDAIWQLLGIYCAFRGALGSGRALGCKEVDFFGQIRPHNKRVTYDVEVRRYSEIHGTYLIIGSGKVYVDNELIYTISDAKVGIFSDIQYPDYPHQSPNSMGGVIKR
ncbi:MAG: bifunctional 3-hydroxydecanoyl-ACP dehydratase/trans-2-decenoyl-ACP isomerase [Legionellales bacterium]|nr:bifunctional 3-hydroxydecanoyl-ACP dehydratase/trans-2-decenoyl-ACP isomerase [Legionellales bacterium]